MSEVEEKQSKWVEAIGVAANSKAAEKLADAVKGIVALPHKIIDCAAGAERIRAIGEAKAAVKLAEGQVILKLQEHEEDLKYRAAARLQYTEIRNQENIEAITNEAYKALPNDDTQISDTPPSEDFVNLFYEECKGIGNEQMQQIWGKLLAGEVTAPGTFHIKTLRVLKDMQPTDAQIFSRLCNVSMRVINLTPIVFNLEDAVYKKFCPTFDQILHLEALGLIRFDTVGGFKWTSNDINIPLAVKYGEHVGLIKFAHPALQLGKILYTEAGLQIAKICSQRPEMEFFNYVLSKWRMDGHEITEIPIQPAT